ncbi:MAG: hypothetical protein RL293_441, partial [Bacteroidota bacterium]
AYSQGEILEGKSGERLLFAVS